MGLDLDAEYAAMHRENQRKRSEKRKNKNVAWEVQVLNAELRKGAGTQTIIPHNQYDRFNYKKMLALYNEVKKTRPTDSIWLVGITSDWKYHNIFYHAGVD